MTCINRQRIWSWVPLSFNLKHRDEMLPLSLSFIIRPSRNAGDMTWHCNVWFRLSRIRCWFISTLGSCIYCMHWSCIYLLFFLEKQLNSVFSWFSYKSIVLNWIEYILGYSFIKWLPLDLHVPYPLPYCIELYSSWSPCIDICLPLACQVDPASFVGTESASHIRSGIRESFPRAIGQWQQTLFFWAGPGGRERPKVYREVKLSYQGQLLKKQHVTYHLIKCICLWNRHSTANAKLSFLYLCWILK